MVIKTTQCCCCSTHWSEKMSRLAAEHMLYNPESPEPTADVRHSLPFTACQPVDQPAQSCCLCNVTATLSVRRMTFHNRQIRKQNSGNVPFLGKINSQGRDSKLAVSLASTEQRFTYLTALFVVKSNHHDVKYRSLWLVSAVMLHPLLVSWRSGAVL